MPLPAYALRSVALRLISSALLLFGTSAAVGAAIATTVGPDGGSAAGVAEIDGILPAASRPPPGPDRTPGSATPAPSGTAPAEPAASTAGAPPRRADNDPVTVPNSGSGRFILAGTGGPVRGTAGRLHRYRIGVEDGTAQEVDAFADAIDAVLGDPRGWAAAGTLRLQRVPAGAAADFSVLLATPVTSEAICATGGLQTAGFTSCRLPGRVVLNLARWLTGVQRYGAPLAEYRHYLVNHEVGHQLGHGHEACPGRGRPAPVMQQQTYGLNGCVAYGWPYLDGRRYRGPRVP
jgi:hypothetical protein